MLLPCNSARAYYDVLKGSGKFSGDSRLWHYEKPTLGGSHSGGWWELKLPSGRRFRGRLGV